MLLTLLRSQPGDTSKERLKRLMFSPYENRADRDGDEKLFFAGLVPGAPVLRGPAVGCAGVQVERHALV